MGQRIPNLHVHPPLAVIPLLGFSQPLVAMVTLRDQEKRLSALLPYLTKFVRSFHFYLPKYLIDVYVSPPPPPPPPPPPRFH